MQANAGVIPEVMIGIDGAVKIILEFAKLKQEQNKAKAAKPEEKKES